MATAAAFAARLFFVFAMRTRLFFEQGLPIGDGDLIIIRVDFRKSEKTVAIAAVVDEGGLERRLHPRDFGEINIAAQRLLVGRFEIEFLDPITP